MQLTQVRSGEAPVEIFIPVFNLYTSYSNRVIMSSAFPVNGDQDLHENLLCTGDAAFLGYHIKVN